MSADLKAPTSVIIIRTLFILGSVAMMVSVIHAMGWWCFVGLVVVFVGVAFLITRRTTDNPDDELHMWAIKSTEKEFEE